jgi:hypothetical protein
MHRIFFILFAITLTSCASLSSSECSGVYKLDGMGWYKEQMQAAHVRPLCATQNVLNESFRLIWLRSFHNPIVVTLTKRPSGIRLEAVRLDGAGGYEPGRIVERKIVDLTVSEYQEFVTLTQEMKFWSLKSYDQILDEAMSNNGEIIIGTDGARWVLEGANSDAAHAADRWSPDKGPFLEASLFLLNKSGISLNGPVY